MKRFTVWDTLLIILLIFHLISNSLWIILNNAPFPWDQATHAGLSVQIADYLKSYQFAPLLSASFFYPTMIHTLGAFLLVIFGPYLKLTQVLSTVLFLGTLTTIYLYFTQISKSKKIAFITTLLFSFFPMIFNFSKWIMVDIPSVGSIFLTLYFWEKSQMFTNRKYTLLTFIALGLLLMVKWSGILFLVIPFLMTAWHFIRHPQKITKIVSIFYGMILTLLICLPWYLTNLQNFIFLSKIYLVGETGVDPNILTVANFTRYIDEFINLQTTPYFTIVFFFCAVILLFKKWQRKYFVFSMIIVSYFIFTFISNKDGRYTMPILPFTAFIVAYGLERLKKTYQLAGNIILILLLSILFVYYLLLTIRPPLLEGKYISFNMNIIRFDFFNLNDWLVTKHDNNTWELSTIIHDVGEASQNQPITIMIAIENPHLNSGTFQTYLAVEKYQGRFNNIQITTPDITYLVRHYNANNFPSLQDLEKYLATSDYVLLSPNNLGPHYIRNYDALKAIRDYIAQNHERTTTMCRNYIENVADKNTTCIVEKNEIVTTESDISIDGKPITPGAKTIEGFAEVSCPFGCSFQLISQPYPDTIPTTKLIKQYTLPDETIVNLYKLR